MRVTIRQAQELTARCFRGAAVSPADSKWVAELLVDAEARGKATHGLVRVGPELTRLRDTQREAPSISHDTKVSCCIDGGGGQGYVVARLGLEKVLEKAVDTGLALVAIHNVGHTGHLGFFVRKLAHEGLIGVACGHCMPLVAPEGTAEAVLGTNPVAFAFPQPTGRIEGGIDDEVAFVSDLATSQITRGEILVKQRTGGLLDFGVALGIDGKITTDATRVTTILPIGGHKGSALALAIQGLCLAAGGAAIPPPGRRYALLLAAIRPDLFVSREAFDAELVELMDGVKGARLRPGASPTRLPGEESASRFRRACRDGLEVEDELWAELQTLAKPDGRLR